MSVRTTIILADDHEVVRVGMRDALTGIEPSFDIHEAANLSEAVDFAVERSAVDLALLDLNMPGMNGTSGIAMMRDASPATPVAIISGSTRDEDIEASLAAGAIGFVPKTMRLLSMANAVRLMLSGEKYVPMDFFERRNKAETEAGLTARELDALRAVARGLSNKQIARELGIAEVTVKLHVANLFRKIGVANRTQAAIRARELGLS